MPTLQSNIIELLPDLDEDDSSFEVQYVELKLPESHIF